MELINKNFRYLGHMFDVFDKKNMANCIYYSNNNLENKIKLFFDVSKLSFVNQNILYTIADVYTDMFSFGDNLVEDSNSFVTYNTQDRKKDFAQHRYCCFSFEDLGLDFNDYMIGFFLELANVFVEQEPVPTFEIVYTVEDNKRYDQYFKNAREDLKDINLIVSLGKEHPLQKDKKAKHAAIIKFSNGDIVKRHNTLSGVIAKNFSLTTNKAISNYNKYNFEKEKEEKIKQKTKNTNNSWN